MSASPIANDVDLANVAQDAKSTEEGRPVPGTDLVLRSTSTTTVASSTATISRHRARKAQTTHWLAAGSKDGKVSLWDIY